MTEYRNVCEIIVPSDLCIGCGICAAVCPPQVLRMEDNAFGEYIAVEYREGCLPKCDVCLKACPFYDQTDNESTLATDLFANIASKPAQEVIALEPMTPKIIDQPLVPPHVHPEIGYYHEIFAGHALLGEQRLEGSSGGVATWLLQTLLREQIVDYVICPAPTNDPSKLFEFVILDDIDAVQAASRSCYYPVEASQVIQHVLQHDGRYAITGLPCLIKGLRLAMRRSKRLRQRIPFTIGLVCGQTKSKFYVEYLAALRGAPNIPLDKVRFRQKSSQRPANDYGIEVSWHEPENVPHRETVYWTEGLREVWTSDMFKPNACNFCDDIFAETADVTVMDAWLPRYIRDYRGHTLVVNRNPDLTPIFAAGVERGELAYESINIEDIARSQKQVIYEKRAGTSYRLATKFDPTDHRPLKRVPPDRQVGSWAQRYAWNLKWQIRRESRLEWSISRSYTRMRKRIWWYQWQLVMFAWSQRLGASVREGRLLTAMQKRLHRLLKRRGR